MRRYRLYIEQKEKKYNYYNEQVVLEFDNVVAATKIIESVLATADPQFDTQCRLETIREADADESIQTPEG